METGHYKVLVVDDVEKNLQLIGNLLADKGISIILASNGKQAITAAKKAKPDLILLDIAMPEMDGYDACDVLKKDKATRDIPIIFLTAKNESDDIIKGFAYGAVDYITKPFNKDELISRVLTHLELKKSRDIIQQQNQQLEVQNIKILDHAKKVEILNNNLKETNKELNESNATKDKFFSIISHDLKNPMSNILNLAELISSKIDKYDKDKLKEMITILSQSTEKINKLLLSLLEWAQAQSGRLHYKPEKIFVAKEIRDSFVNQHASAKLKNIELTYDCPEDITANGDLNMFCAILRNLLSNAIKFTNEGGKVGVTLSKKTIDKNPFLEIKVTDTGIGMPKNALDALFSIGASKSTTGTKGETGTGLGLILCKEYAEKNRGTLSVASQVDKGSTFTFTIPEWKD